MAIPSATENRRHKSLFPLPPAVEAERFSPAKRYCRPRKYKEQQFLLPRLGHTARDWRKKALSATSFEFSPRPGQSGQTVRTPRPAFRAEARDAYLGAAQEYLERRHSRAVAAQPATFAIISRPGSDCRSGKGAHSPPTLAV